MSHASGYGKLSPKTVDEMSLENLSMGFLLIINFCGSGKRLGVRSLLGDRDHHFARVSKIPAKIINPGMNTSYENMRLSLLNVCTFFLKSPQKLL